MTARLCSTKLGMRGFYEGGIATLEMELHDEDWSEFIDFCKARPKLDSVRFEDDGLVIRFKPLNKPLNDTKETKQ